MTDNDKALVERLRSGRWLGETTCGPAADRIETLNAILKAAEESMGDQLAARKEQADRIEAQAAKINRISERLIEAIYELENGYLGSGIASIVEALGETE